MKRKILLSTLFIICSVIITGCQKQKVFQISVKESKVSLAVGDEYILEYQVIDQNNKIVTKDAQVESDNDTIIKVIDNKLMALRTGKAVVKITLIDDSNIWKEIEVTVVDKPTITVKNKVVNMFVGAKTTIDYEIKNGIGTEKVVTNVIGISNSITIENLTIHAINTGEAQVKVFLENNPEQFELINVKVIENVNEETKISINNEKKNYVLLAKAQLIVIVTPSTIQDQIIYESSNQNIITVDDNGLIEMVGLGKCVIKASLDQNPDIYCEVEFNVELDPMFVMEQFHIEDLFSQSVPIYGYTNGQEDSKWQWVTSSVSRYFNSNLNLITNREVEIKHNKFSGQVATPQIIAEAEAMKIVRTGILHEETKYIIYHDTANFGNTANALAHANYMESADNLNNRARSWHYTVDQDCVYYHIPNNEVAWQGDTYDAYAMGIGVETCVNYGSDLYATWQRTAKLMASLLVEKNLGLDAVLQHYDFNQKNCPRTLRESNLYDHAKELIWAEFITLQFLADYNISFKSLSPDYVDDRGRIIDIPKEPIRVGYQVTITKDGYDETKNFYSYLGPYSGEKIEATAEQIRIANLFDQNVLSLPITVTIENEKIIEKLVLQYDSFDPILKNLVVTADQLALKEKSWLQLIQSNANIIIDEIYTNQTNNSRYRYGYIQLYNPSDQDISLEGMYLLTTINQNDFDLTDQSKEIYWHHFGTNAKISAHGYYLIQGALVNNEHHFELLYLPLADAVTNLIIPSNNGMIALVTEMQVVNSEVDSHVVDLVGIGNDCRLAETDSVIYDSSSKAIRRKYQLDTNHNARDFIIYEPNPINSLKEETNLVMTEFEKMLMEVDMLIKSLDRDLTLGDEDLIDQMINSFSSLTIEEQRLLKCYDLYQNILLSFEVVKNPALEVINKALSQIPKQIVNNYVLPNYDGLSYRYKNEEDQKYYDLVTGEYLQTSFEAKYLTIILEYQNYQKEVIINFGVANNEQKIIYNTGNQIATGGSVHEGYGTYSQQQNSIGFGGVAIIVKDKVYFIGEKAYIPLYFSNKSELTMKDLRPYGSANSDILYNQGLVKGVPSATYGAGSLYHNTSNHNLIFDPSYTYGRNGAGIYGYHKIIFRPTPDGTYRILAYIPDHGDNISTSGQRITLEPGDYLWCPHIFDAGNPNGTWLMGAGYNGSTGVLVVGDQIDILHYKNFI